MHRMSEDLVNIEVDGRPLQARKGQMLIQATDAAGVYVPRFCYHEKLSVAANCRMCLVEVEKAPKPLPACATPVAEGMKAFTRSPKAIAAQKATMEFLLINHPLDCPICDQGGECELQDLAQGFGSSVSRFTERKRVVKDKNLGPLISTDMTRCIHCTRCVRFTAEIAGKQELGTTGRGEDMEIGTWIERSVDHELSGNVIDLCPVGALNSKPFRHRGRSWEMTQHELVSPHDGIGSNLYGHVLRGQLMRVVPRPNEEINETWISDRDRFSYEGVYSDDRLRAPMLRRDGGWQEVSWDEALTAAAQGLKDALARDGAAGLGVIGTAGATLEELYLLARLARGVGCANVDTRLRQLDFRGQDADPAVPGLGMALTDVDGLEALLVVGNQLRHEAPILAHRVRKAATRNRARVSFVNQASCEWLFPVANEIACGAGGMLGELAGLLNAAAEAKGVPLPANVAALTAGATASAAHRDIVAGLAGTGRRAVLLGALAMRHPAWSDLRDASAALADLTGATLSLLPEGANAAGAALAGALPHRGPSGEPVAAGLDTVAMLSKPLPAYLLFGGVEPESDTLVPGAVETLGAARLVVAVTPYVTETLKSYAHVLLPIGTFAETSGTYVNVEGRWQSFTGCVRPLGEARPGWKVLRVLGNLLRVEGFDYDSSDQVREELRSRQPAQHSPRSLREVGGGATGPVADVALYGADAIVRRAPALQHTRDAGRAAVQG
jgi:NADH-quinone oxidoreductase subunit G